MDILGGLAALGRGTQGALENQRAIEKGKQDNVLRNRAFARGEQAAAIDATAIDATAIHAAGGAGGISGPQAGGLSMAAPAIQVPNTGTASAQAEQTDPLLGEQDTVLKGLQAKRAAALKANRYDLWETYGQQANSVRNGMIQRLAQRGMQQYALDKNLKALLPAASLVEDGQEFNDVQRGADGAIIVQRSQYGKSITPLTYKDDKEALQALQDYINPTAASQRAKQFSDMMVEVHKKQYEAEATEAAKAKYREPQKPFAVKQSGEHAGEAVFDPTTRTFVRPPGFDNGSSGGAGNGSGSGANGAPAYGPAYARLFPGSKNLEKDVQEITGKMVPEMGIASGDGKSMVPVEQARLDFQSNLARVAASNPNLNDLPTVAKTARVLTLQQYGVDTPGYSKPTIARDFNSGRLQAEVQTPEGRVVIPSDMAKASPVQAMQADEQWMRKVFANAPLYKKVDAIINDAQGRQLLAQALQNSQARADFEQRSGLPVELFRTVAAWRMAKGEDLPYPAQADPQFSGYLQQIQAHSQSQQRPASTAPSPSETGLSLMTDDAIKAKLASNKIQRAEEQSQKSLARDALRKEAAAITLDAVSKLSSEEARQVRAKYGDVLPTDVLRALNRRM